jgi:hypothetical protein
MVTTKFMKPFVGVLVFLAAFAVLGGDASANYTNLSDRIPDDNYLLRHTPPRSGFANPDGSDCYVGNPPEGTCVADYSSGGISHQYITLSPGQIDDSVRDSDYFGADSSSFVVYTTTPEAKSISIDTVERAIQNLGCSGYTLRYTYIFGVSQGAVPNGSGTVTPNGCRGYGLGSVPAAAFQPYRVANGQMIYKAIIQLQITGSGNRQASFHMNVGGGARLGYAANSWVNMYPTNAADQHRLDYRFRPDCGMRAGATFTIGWDDVDYPSGFQPGRPTVRLYTTDSAGGNKVMVQEWLNPGSSTQFRTISMDGRYFEANGTPKGLVVEFGGVDGGNGISFIYPYDSSAAFLDCEAPPTQDPGAVKSCELFEHTMGANSIYRFTAFPRDINYATASPAEGTTQPTQGGWKTFNAPQDWVQVVNSGSGTRFSRAHQIPPRGNDRLVYIERWNNNGNGTWTYTSGTSAIRGCYKGDTVSGGGPGGICTMRIVAGGISGLSNAAPVGGTITIRTTVYNTGIMPLPDNYNGIPLALTIPGGTDFGGQRFPVGGLAPGQSRDVDFNVTLTGGLRRYNITAIPDYSGLFAIGGGCTLPLDAYARYDFTGSVNPGLYDNQENPRGVNFISTMRSDQNYTPSASLPGSGHFITRSFYSKQLGQPKVPIPNFGTRSTAVNPFQTTTITDQYTIASGVSVDTGYCMVVSADLGHGWWQSATNFVNEGPETATNCAEPVPCAPGSPGCTISCLAGQPNCRICPTADPSSCRDCEDGDTACGVCVPGDPECEVCAPGDTTCCLVSDPSCSPVLYPINLPYIRTYGGDVNAGGGFESIDATINTCQRPRVNGQIPSVLTFMNTIPEQNNNNMGGSGGQLATSAMGTVEGFVSASIRSAGSPPTIQRGLSFGNNSAIANPNTVKPTLSNNGDTGGICAPDFYRDMQYPDSDTTNKNIIDLTDFPRDVNNPAIGPLYNNAASATNAPGGTTLFLDQIATGKQTLIKTGRGTGDERQLVIHSDRDRSRVQTASVGNPIPVTGERTIFVDGDLYLRHNFVYADWSATGIPPNLTFVVKGNIIIDNDEINQIDGLLIAQPDGIRPAGLSGNIYTCGTITSGFNPSTIKQPEVLFFECGGSGDPTKALQLRINGALISERVLFNRTSNSLRNATSNREPLNNTRASEVINFSPELYITPPLFKPSRDYQSMNILSPIL